MTFDFSIWNHLMIIIGWITVLFILGVILTAFFLVAIALYSIHRGRLVFPRFFKAGLVGLEGLTKAILRFLGLEDRELTTFLVRMHNVMSKKSFSEVPVADRAVFIPQCLRSAKCPARLTPEGLKCQGCGLCGVGEFKKNLEDLGYTRFFIVPGSSFIRRMIRKYRPKALLGVGCLLEIKDALDMADKTGLIAMAVVTTKEGCVETEVCWDELIETASLGLRV